MKKVLFLLHILLCSIYCHAQVTVQLSQLVGTKWTIDGGGKVGEDTLIFYKDKEVDIVFFPLLKRASVINRPFYLSETFPKFFDHSKVGTSTSGCFIIGYNNKLKRMTVLQIRSFDLAKGEMVFYNPHIKDAIRDGTIKYKLISSDLR